MLDIGLDYAHIAFINRHFMYNTLIAYMPSIHKVWYIVVETAVVHRVA